MGHFLVSLMLAFLCALVTFALGYEHPWPLIIGVAGFLLYWGVCIVILDADWF